MITSDDRPLIATKPSVRVEARSPVFNQPSGANATSFADESPQYPRVTQSPRAYISPTSSGADTSLASLAMWTWKRGSNLPIVVDSSASPARDLRMPAYSRRSAHIRRRAAPRCGATQTASALVMGRPRRIWLRVMKGSASRNPDAQQSAGTSPALVTKHGFGRSSFLVAGRGSGGSRSLFVSMVQHGYARESDEPPRDLWAGMSEICIFISDTRIAVCPKKSYKFRT